MLVTQQVGQHERVEPVVFDRRHLVTLSGPGRNARRDWKDGMPPCLQVLHQQAFGPLHRDRQAAAKGGHLPVQLGQPSNVMPNSPLDQASPGQVHQAQLVLLSSPVNAGEHLEPWLITHLVLLDEYGSSRPISPDAHSGARSTTPTGQSRSATAGRDMSAVGPRTVTLTPVLSRRQ